MGRASHVPRDLYSQSGTQLSASDFARKPSLKRSSPRHKATVAAELLQHPKSLATHRLSTDPLSHQNQSSLSSCPTASSISSCFGSLWTPRRLSQSQAKRLKNLSQMAAKSFSQMCMQLRKPTFSRTGHGQLQTSSTLASWCSFMAFVWQPPSHSHGPWWDCSLSVTSSQGA